MVLVIFAVLFILFRNLRGVLIPMGFVFTALIWTFGLMAWTGTPLSILTMIVPVFVISTLSLLRYVIRDNPGILKTVRTYGLMS